MKALSVCYLDPNTDEPTFVECEIIGYDRDKRLTAIVNGETVHEKVYTFVKLDKKQLTAKDLYKLPSSSWLDGSYIGKKPTNRDVQKEIKNAYSSSVRYVVDYKSGRADRSKNTKTLDAAMKVFNSYPNAILVRIVNSKSGFETEVLLKKVENAITVYVCGNGKSYISPKRHIGL